MKAWLSLFLSAGLVALDVQSLFWFLNGSGRAGPLILHILVVCGVAGIVWGRVPTGEERRMTIVLLLFPVVLLIPVFGPAFACGLLLFGGPDSGRGVSSVGHVSLSEILPEGGPEAYSYGATVSSIAEIMRGSDPEKRRHATLSLKNLKAVDSLPILRRLTQDDDEIVRLFALGERRRITGEFEERSRSLARKRKEKTASVSDLLNLAESYLEEVEVGLPVDELQRKAILEKTLDVLWEARRRDPERIDIEFDLLRCALAAFDVEVADRAFARLLSSGAFDDRLTLQRCEFYFQKGDWGALVEELNKMPESYRQSPRLERVLTLWNPAIRRWAGEGAA